MHHRNRRFSLMLAGAVAAGLTAHAEAQYVLTTDIAVPYSSGDGVTGSATASPTPSASAFVNYTTLTITNQFSESSTPNGAYTLPIVGYSQGTINGSSPSVSVSTGWAYDPTYGFRLVGYYTETSTGSHSFPTFKGANSIGIIGYDQRASAFNTSTSLLGQEAWYDVNATNTSTSIGLMGTGFGFTYQNSAGTVFGTYRNSTPNFLNASGQIVGTTARYAGVSGTSANQNLGTSAWISNGAGTPTEIGLTGSGYSYNASGTVTPNTGATPVPYTGTYYNNGENGLTASGDVLGSASNYFDKGNGTATGLGTDGWYYNTSAGAAATTTPVGLYYSTITPAVAGFANQTYSYGYQIIGPATPSTLNTYRSTSVNTIASSGMIGGTSQYYNSSSTSTTASAVGQDAFIYKPSTGNYIMIGLVSNGFATQNYPQPLGVYSFVNPTGARSSNVNLMNDNNLVAGNSTVYVGAGNNSDGSIRNYVETGSAAWVANALTGLTTQIGLYNQNTAAHVGTLGANNTFGTYGVYSEQISAMTQSGFVAGAAQRYNQSNGSNYGADAWVYDSKNGITFPVDPKDESNAQGYYFSSVTYLSEGGVAIGRYEVGKNLPYNAFIWSEADGFADLGSSIILNGLSSAGYQAITNAYVSDTLGNTLYGIVTNNNTSTSPTIRALVTLTGSEPVPEPTSLGLLAIGATALLGRSRRARA